MLRSHECEAAAMYRKYAMLQSGETKIATIYSKYLSFALL